MRLTDCAAAAASDTTRASPGAGLSRRAALIASACLAGTGAAWAQPTGTSGDGRAETPLSPLAPPELAAQWPRAHLQGEGVMRVFGFHIADLRLWLPEPPDALNRVLAEAGDAGWRARELALELQYARRFDAPSLAQRSLQEMQRAGPIEPALASRWQQALTALLADVERGDRITGHQLPQRSARFFHNGRMRGELPDAQFVPRFFAIWLGEQSSQPKLRAQLLGTER